MIFIFLSVEMMKLICCLFVYFVYLDSLKYLIVGQLYDRKKTRNYHSVCLSSF